MSLTYDSYITSLANMLVVPSTDANFLLAVNNIIDDSEGRIYRDLDLLGTVTRTSTGLVSTASRNITLPSSVRFTVLDAINIYTPVGTTTTRNPLVPVSLEFADAVWPQETSSNSSTVPQFFAMVTDQTVVLVPPPGSPFNLEVVGTIRPSPLSSGNSSTYLTTYLPDLFLTAGCMFGAAYLKNFGAATDDPRSGVTWSANYQALLQSAMTDENRKKFRAEGWTSKQPSPVATPPRA